MRVMLSALEHRLHTTIPSSHPVVAWLVEHAASTLNKYLISHDGKTGYERIYGKPCREEALEFGEQIH